MRWIHINIGGYFVHPNSGTHHSDNHRIQRKEGSLANDTRVWEKFLHLRSFTWSGNWAKSSRPVWRKVTLRPPGLLWMPPSPAVVTIKRPAIQPSPSLSTHFSINMKMAKESQTQIYKFAPSIQWKDTPSKFFQMVCTAGQKLKLGQFWSLQRSPHLKIGKHEMDSVK